MTETKPDKRGKGWAFYCTVIFAVLMLYILSVGPIIRYRCSDRSRRSSLKFLCVPVWKVAAWYPAFGEPLQAYINLWLPDGQRVVYEPGIGFNTVFE